MKGTPTLLALLLAVWICIKFTDLKSTEIIQANPCILCILFCTWHSINTYQTDILESVRYSDLPGASKDRTETCIRVKFSYKFISPTKPSGPFFTFATESTESVYSLLTAFQFPFSACVHVGEATAKRPVFATASVQDWKENSSFNMSPFHFDKHWFIF